jgi:NMD protein affecting ribosome stability and mRNA decay
MKCLYSLLAFIFFAMALAARKAKNELVKKDVPLIACDVCKRTIGMVYNTTEQERQDAPYNKLNEIDINDIVENICNHESKTGEWIRGLDIVEVTEGDKTYLNLVAPGGTLAR